MLPVKVHSHKRLSPPAAVNCYASSLPTGPVLVISHNELAVTGGLSSGWPGMRAGLPQASDHSGFLGVRSKDMTDKRS